MSDLISRSKVIEELNFLKYIGYDKSGVMKLQNMEIQRCISVIEDAPAVVPERSQDDIISREALKEDFIETINSQGFMTTEEIISKIDNAPTVERPIRGIAKVGKNGEIEIELINPQGECKKCDYRKFTETFIDGVVDVMNKNGITSVEQLQEILKGVRK